MFHFDNVFLEKSYFAFSLGGVPLAYRKIKTLNKLVPIIDEHPCLHIDAEVELVVFKPITGHIIDCKFTYRKIISTYSEF